MADAIGPKAAVIEPGSGASLKTELLIDALESCAGYIPSDISDTMLAIASKRFAERFPGLPIRPLHADFMQDIDLPEDARLGARRVVYFPGSTVGNFGNRAQRDVLGRFKRLAGEGGCLLVGFDRVKAVSRMEAAYNDAAGVTADFNLNMIERLNTEFGVKLDRSDFEFNASWDPDRQAIVSHLTALRPIRAEINGRVFRLETGQRIQTEESHKYTPERISELAASCGLGIDRVWCDGDEDFAVVLLSRS